MVPGAPRAVLSGVPAGTPLRCGVVGNPVAHSRSPAIHRAAYAQLGLDWTYDRITLEPGSLPDFVRGLDASWRGLSVTMPHKEDAARLGRPDEMVALTGVANTIVLGGAETLVANTDVAGFVIALRACGIEAADRVAVVGNGATARSAVAAAYQLGAKDLQVLCRNPARAAGLLDLAGKLGISGRPVTLGQVPDPVDLLISTVPSAGVADHADGLAAKSPVVFDAIYHPWPTPLTDAASRADRVVLGGLDLLAGQAVDQVRWFTGQSIDFDLARNAAQAAVHD